MADFRIFPAKNITKIDVLFHVLSKDSIFQDLAEAYVRKVQSRLKKKSLTKKEVKKGLNAV